jgi:hypothetical protein
MDAWSAAVLSPWGEESLMGGVRRGQWRVRRGGGRLNRAHYSWYSRRRGSSRGVKTRRDCAWSRHHGEKEEW